MTGTIINALAILIGGTIGILFKSKIPSKYTDITFQAIGLFTLFLGIHMSFHTQEFLVLVFSLLIGGILGEMLDLEGRITRMGDTIQKRFFKNSSKFTEGLVTSFLLFCIGSLTILGAIEEGLGNDPNLLITKSLMDGFSSIALTTALGVGVIFSIIPLLIYQGGLTFLAMWFGDFFNEAIINELTATGGIILIGLGINLLQIKKIKVINLLPALIIVVLIMLLLEYIPFSEWIKNW